MPDRPTYTLVLTDAAAAGDAAGDAKAVVRLRGALKRLLRTYSFRCTFCVEGDVARTKFLLVKCKASRQGYTRLVLTERIGRGIDAGLMVGEMTEEAVARVVRATGLPLEDEGRPAEEPAPVTGEGG